MKVKKNLISCGDLSIPFLNITSEFLYFLIMYVN